MSRFHALRKILFYPPHVSARKAFRLVKGRVTDALRSRVDLSQTTYATPATCARPALQGGLFRYFKATALERLRPHAWAIAGLTERYLRHEFDVLGSGWVQVKHGQSCAGVEGGRYGPEPPLVADAQGAWLSGRINAANLFEGQRLWRLVAADDQPIDWHLDFKSGFRWSESTWSRRIVYRRAPGAVLQTERFRVDVSCEGGAWRLEESLYSPAYGWAEPCQTLVADHFDGRFEWMITLAVCC